MTANQRPATPECPLAVLRPPAAPVSVVVPIAGIVDDDGGAALCRAVRVLLGDHACTHASAVGVVTCDTTDAEVDLGLVGALARLALTARRHGCALRLRGAGAELGRLVAFAGLAGVLPAGDAPAPTSAGEHG